MYMTKEGFRDLAEHARRRSKDSGQRTALGRRKIDSRLEQHVLSHGRRSTDFDDSEIAVISRGAQQLAREARARTCFSRRSRWSKLVRIRIGQLDKRVVTA